MALENTNLVQAAFQLRSDAATGIQLIGGAGVVAATLGRTGAGDYTIELEQALTRAVPAFPAQGEVDYMLLPNIEAAGDWRITATLEAGVGGQLNRVRISTLLAGVADDPAATEPFGVMVIRFPSNA